MSRIIPVRPPIQFPHPCVVAGVGTVNAAGGGGTFWAGVLDPSRGYDWTRAGVEGGIPTNRTKDGATITAGTSTANINSRIANAGQNTYLEFGSGTFNIGGLSISRNNVTLKGQGANLTNFIMSGNSSLLGLAASIACGSAFHEFGAPAHSASWTGGLSAGSTDLTLGSAPTGLQVGDLLYLDQLNSTGIASTGILVGSSLPFSYDGGGGGGDPGNREQTETQRVVAINGNVVTVYPGVRCMNWSAGRSPRASWTGVRPIIGVGIEDLMIDHTSAGGDRGIAFLGVRNCWVSRVKSRFAPRNHCWIYQSLNCEFRDSFIYEGQSHATQSYGVETGDSSDCLTENNISVRVTSAWMISGCSVGCVRAYNYSTLDLFAGDWMQGANYDHCTGSQYVLDEGNITPGAISDQVHGPTALHTQFRNCYEGWESGKAQQTIPLHWYTYSRYPNFIGNVLGRSGFHTNYESYPGSGVNAYTSCIVMGYGDNGSNGGGSNPANDAFVRNSSFRWGNCCAHNGFTPNFNSAEVPTAISGGYTNAVPSNQTLRASFYRSSRPAFFGAAAPITWPPIGPDVTAGNIANKGGHANNNPAAALYAAATKDANGEITFNGSAYYS